MTGIDDAVASAANPAGKSIAMIGFGNVGSPLVPLVARLPEVCRVVLVDPDTYEAKNFATQNILPADVGRPKALVQAERLRDVNASLQAVPIVDAVERVPRGALRVDALVACVDSRAARRAINQLAWRLGIPWVDSGVHAADLLARVNVYVPGRDQPCLECAWDERDYAMLEQAYPCGGDAAAAPTNAPPSLGALAAALIAIELQKVLSGQWQWAAVGRQVTISASHHRHYVTTFGRNPACRFDHRTWDIEWLDRRPQEMTLADALALAPLSGAAAALRIEGHTFVRRLSCPSCGAAKKLFWHLSGRLHELQLCTHCQRKMIATGFDVVDALRANDLPAATSATPLHDLGFRAGDIVTVTSGTTERHFQLGAAVEPVFGGA